MFERTKSFLYRVSQTLYKAFKRPGARGAASVRQSMSSHQPGMWASDHMAESRHFTGWNYVSISAIAKQAMLATVSVYDNSDEAKGNQNVSVAKSRKLLWRSRSVKKSFIKSDENAEPLDTSHPFVKLMKRPNPTQSFASFQYERVQQLALTGTCLVWKDRNQFGKIIHLYVVPTAICTPVAPSREYPRGGYKVQPYHYATRYVGDDGFVETQGYFRILGQTIGADDLQIIRWPHPIYKDDGCSPLSAGSTWIDTSTAIDRSRWEQNKQGAYPSMVVTPEDDVTDPDELAKMEIRLNQKFGGANNVGKIMVAAHGKVSPLGGTSPVDMAYESGFDQMGTAVRSLHGVPEVAIGMTDGQTYGGLAASMRGFSWLSVYPYLKLIGDEDEIQLASEFGDDLTVEYEPSSIDDPELEDKQIETAMKGGYITKGEGRHSMGFKPFGDERDDEIAGAAAPGQQSGQQPGMDSGMPTLDGIGEHPGLTGMPSLPGVQQAKQQQMNGKPNLNGNSNGMNLPRLNPSQSQLPNLPKVGKDGRIGLKAMDGKKWRSSQIEAGDDIAAHVQDIRDALDPEDVLQDGGKPHVTIRYGISPNDKVEKVNNAVSKFGVVPVKYGGFDIFENPEADVLHVKVDSSALGILRKQIERSIACKIDDHASYTPHLTIAYLKPGTGKKYLDDLSNPFEGQTEVHREFTITNSAEDEGSIVSTATAKKACGKDCSCVECRSASRKVWLKDAMDRTMVLAERSIFKTNGSDIKFEKAIRDAHKELHKIDGRMPGYGQCFVKDHDVWYVGGDGDTREFGNNVTSIFENAGAESVRYEAESFPPNDECWKRVDTTKKTMGMLSTDIGMEGNTEFAKSIKDRGCPECGGEILTRAYNEQRDANVYTCVNGHDCLLDELVRKTKIKTLAVTGLLKGGYGDGAGGFENGNTCARGGSGSSGTNGNGDHGNSEKVKQKVHTKESKAADKFKADKLKNESDDIEDLPTLDLSHPDNAFSGEQKKETKQEKTARNRESFIKKQQANLGNANNAYIEKVLNTLDGKEKESLDYYTDDARGFNAPQWRCGSSVDCLKKTAGSMVFDIAKMTKAKDIPVDERYPPERPLKMESKDRHTNEQGEWTPERRSLHNEIHQKAFDDKSPVEHPVTYMMGGGPAAGKSAIIKAGAVVLPKNTIHVDNDEIKAQLPEYKTMVERKHPGAAMLHHEESSILGKRISRSATVQHYNTILDGTGDSGIDSLASKVSFLKDHGHRVVAHYVTKDTEQSVSDALARAAKSGRTVPVDFIRQTHAEVSRIVPQAIERGLFDEFHLWDTNDRASGPRHVAEAHGSQLTVHDPKLWEDFLAKGK